MYDALIAFGYGPVQPTGHGKLTMFGRTNALAAGMLYDRHDINKIIPTGGRTGGAHLPSEAALMAGIMQRRFEIPADAFILEEEALTTLMNAAFVSNIIDGASDRYQTLMMVGMGWHISRIKAICRIFGLPGDAFVAAEDVVRERSKRHAMVLADELDVEKNPRYARHVAQQARWMRGLHETPAYVLPAVGLVENMTRVRSILRRAGPHIQSYMEAHGIDLDTINDLALRAWLHSISYEHPSP